MSIIGRFKKTLEEEIPGVYVLSLKITGDSSGDYDSSFFIHPVQQVTLFFYILLTLRITLTLNIHVRSHKWLYF